MAKPLLTEKEFMAIADAVGSYRQYLDDRLYAKEISVREINTLENAWTKIKKDYYEAGGKISVK